MEFSASNTVWVLVAAALVFFMQAGFCILESGLTRAKNAGNIIMKNLMDFSIGTPVFWLVGFGIMFGSSNAIFGGFDFTNIPRFQNGVKWNHLPINNCSYSRISDFCVNFISKI